MRLGLHAGCECAQENLTVIQAWQKAKEKVIEKHEKQRVKTIGSTAQRNGGSRQPDNSQNASTSVNVNCSRSKDAARVGVVLFVAVLTLV